MSQHAAQLNRVALLSPKIDQDTHQSLVAQEKYPHSALKLKPYSQAN